MRLIFLIVHLTEYSYFLVIIDSKWNAAERFVQVTDETFFGGALYSCQVHVLLITCVANLLFGIGLLVPGSKALAVAIINCCVRSPSIFDNFRGNQTKPNP